MISVLLIDRALEGQRSIRKLLLSSLNNFDLHCASSYFEIVDGFTSKTSDVCLIDAEIETGRKLFAQARSLGYTPPIILVTPNDARQTIKAIHEGVSDCLIRTDLSAAAIEHSVCSVVEQARSSLLQNQREHRYLALVDHASEIVYTHDLEGNLTSINRTGEQFLGYSQSEILGMNVSQLMAPEDHLLVRSMIARTLDAQTQTSDKVQLITRRGARLTVEIHTHPINQDGKTFEIQGVASIPSQTSEDLPWNSQGVLEDDQTDGMSDVEMPRHGSYEAPDIFPLQRSSADRSLHIF